MELSKIKQIVINRHFLPIALFVVMDIVIVSFAGYLGWNLYSKYNDLEIAQMELDTTKQKANLIKNNLSLLQGDIEKYNEVLDTLIPDDESYFKVIAAFEQLGARTGVSIESYSINLDSTTEEKLSLELSVQGEQESIEKLLQEYNYVSGRLITNEDVSLYFGDENTISFSVNLIHKAYSESGDEIITISASDIEYLDEIIQKMK